MNTTDIERFDRLTEWARRLFGEEWWIELRFPVEGVHVELMWLNLERVYRDRVTRFPTDVEPGLTPMPESVELERRGHPSTTAT